MAENEAPDAGALVVARADADGYRVRQQDEGDPLADPRAFAHWYRVAKMMALSQLIPEHLQGKVPDVMIGLSVAHTLRLQPLTVLQNLYVVKGTPGWKTQFLIALAMRAGWDIDYEVEELGAPIEYQRSTKSGTVKAKAANLRVRCHLVRDRKTKVGPWVSTEQAIAARWADNEQYAHSTENQLCWRAAAFALRRHDPNLTLGLPTVEELEAEAEETERPARIRVEPPAPQNGKPQASPSKGAAALDTKLADLVGSDPPPPSSSPDKSAAAPPPVPDTPPEPASGGGSPPADDDPRPSPDALVLKDATEDTLEKAGRFSLEGARKVFAQRLGLAKVSAKRFDAAVGHGVVARWWDVVDKALVKVATGEEDEDLPAEAGGVDLAKYEGMRLEELLKEITRAEAEVGVEFVPAIRATTGIKGDIQGEQLPKIREYLAALDRVLVGE